MPRQVQSALPTTLRNTLAVALLGSLATWHASSLADSADNMALKMSEAVAPDRFFVRAGAIEVRIKTKAGDTYDVTGPILTRAQLEKIVAPTDTTIENYILAKNYLSNSTVTEEQLTAAINSVSGIKKGTKGIGALLRAMSEQEIPVTQIGTPPGIKAIAQEKVGTAGISLGYFLDDEYKWLVEAYVLAKPVSVSVSVNGPGSLRVATDGVSENTVGPFSIAGQKILTSKLLPPTVMLGRYWGDKDAKFRPYTGLIAMYAMMYDTKATELLNSYVGGGNPGDTTVSLKNTFGIGPMLGIKYQMSDQWHLSLNVGSVKLKTVGTIVTRNSSFTKSTGATQDLGPFLTEFLQNAEALLGSKAGLGPGQRGGDLGQVLEDNPEIGGVTGLITKSIAYANGQENSGTFVRKANTTLDSTIFMMSVGHSF